MQKFIKSPILSLRAYDIMTPACKPVAVAGRPFHALSYRKQGKVTLACEDVSLTSASECITLMPKRKSYTTEVLQDTHMIAIHFDCVEEEELQPFVLTHVPLRLQQLFEQMLKTDSACGGSYESYACFYRLLSELEQLLRKQRKEKIIPAVMEAKERIDRDFRDPNFNIDVLVASLPVSASYLRQEFHKVYAITPIGYLRQVRLQNAIDLLASGCCSVTDLAGRCGYSSVAYFVQSFRKSTGYSPLRYKKMFL